MSAPRRHPGSRLIRLERLARARPCPECGRVPVSGWPLEPSEWVGLSAGERDELARLIGAVAVAPCGRCGRPDHDLSRLTDDQRDRMLQLLDRVLGPPEPD